LLSELDKGSFLSSIVNTADFGVAIDKLIEHLDKVIEDFSTKFRTIGMMWRYSMLEERLKRIENQLGQVLQAITGFTNQTTRMENCIAE
jgi:hypothetical protein